MDKEIITAVPLEKDMRGRQAHPVLQELQEIPGVKLDVSSRHEHMKVKIRGFTDETIGQVRGILARYNLDGAESDSEWGKDA